MTRRSKPYQVLLPDGRHDVPAYKFHQYVANRLLVRTGKRTSRPRKGVKAWIEEGALRLLDTLSGVGPCIPSSWRWVELMAIYCDIGPRLSPAEMQREVQRQYVTI